jgi:ABC-type antimicrobial peptide transport system permease subunit
MQIAARAGGVAPAALADGIRGTVAALDPDLALRQLQPMDVTLATVQRYPWLIGRLLLFLAVLGVGLALLGIYGVISRTVAQRTAEFGIRLALGATPRTIVRLVLASGSRLAGAGTAIGLLGASGISRAIAAGWPGMQTNSSAVLGGITLLLLFVSLVACYLPARLASAVSPVSALRAD